MADEKRYDDHEVGLIVKRVVELHERDGGKADARKMTKTEIEQVVGELGLPTALVSRAVSELSVQDLRNRPVWWLGGKTDVMFEDVVDGSIDEATFGQMLEVLRRHLGDPGEVKVEGGARIWSMSRHSSRRIHFTTIEHANKTTLRLEERMPGAARSMVGTSSFLAGFAGFLLVIPLKVFVVKAMLLLAMGPLAATGATAGWLAGRALWKNLSAQREIQLQRIFREILSVARTSTPALPEASLESSH